jgi:hypothetical protein
MPKRVLLIGTLLAAAGVAGVMRIEVNDNPVRWFKDAHPVRIADAVMNRLFGGTYMAYLVVAGSETESIKQPEVVSWIARVQTHLETIPLVGKTSSVADIVQRINLVLHDNDPAWYTVPESAEAVGQFLFLFQSSGDPDDLDNFVNRKADKANIWVQMRSGDNQEMQRVEEHLAEFVRVNPAPAGITLQWSGPTHINKVWQDLMVVGMLKAILGSFAVVFLLMVIEFRSLVLGLLSMIPLGLAILLSYGLVGWVGKDYDMPIAVCSSLSLGLGIDFAIHFLQRYRQHYHAHPSLEETNAYMFGEPGRAIARNAIVITLGFIPLISSSLTPYVTVGTFFALLMVISTLATLFILPAALQILGPRILKGKSR